LYYRSENIEHYSIVSKTKLREIKMDAIHEVVASAGGGIFLIGTAGYAAGIVKDHWKAATIAFAGLSLAAIDTTLYYKNRAETRPVASTSVAQSANPSVHLG
jgi:hypothetical protein